MKTRQATAIERRKALEKPTSASERKRRTLAKPTTIVNIGLKKDLEDILANPKNLSTYFKGNKVTDNSIEVWYKEPVQQSSNLYYEDADLRDSDFELFEKALKEANITL